MGVTGWPAVSLTVSVLLTGVLWAGSRQWLPDATSAAGLPGGFVLFGQTLDGVTTIIGVDLLGFTEQVPLSRLVLSLAGRLPTAEIVGVGWALFVLKIGLAVGLIVVVAPESDGRDGWEQLALVVAGVAGLVPGINNLLLQLTV